MREDVHKSNYSSMDYKFYIPRFRLDAKVRCLVILETVLIHQNARAFCKLCSLPADCNHTV